MHLVNVQQATVSALPPKENTKQTLEAFQTGPDKVGAYISENEDASSAKLHDEQLASPTTTQKSDGAQSKIIPISAKAPAQLSAGNSGGPAMSPRLNQSTASLGSTQTYIPVTGRAGGLTPSSSAPLTASYTPSVAASALPNFHDSSFDPNGSFGRKSLYQPLENSSLLQQNIIPPAQPKKIGSESPEYAKPIVSPYVDGYNVSTLHLSRIVNGFIVIMF